MEPDQEDFATWDASELDRLASDIFAESLEFFSSDGDPGLSNLVDNDVSAASIPVAESANLNTKSAVLLPSPNEVNDYDPFFGASELPAPTQTTSSMQMPLSDNPTEDQPFRSVNLDADASYTDHHPSESLAPIATANSVPVAQSTDFAGNDMSSSNYMDLDAPYADMGFSQFLAPTTTTSLVQPTQSADLMEDRISRIIELDPDPVMTASGPTPTSSEQLPRPVSTDRVLPAEVAQFVNPQTVFDGSAPPDPSCLTSIPHPFAFPPNETIMATPTPEDQLRPKSGNSSPSGGYVPIQPKPAAISQITELPSTREPQDSTLSRSPSQGTLTFRPAPSVPKGKRKRQRSPQVGPSAYKDCLNEFSIAAKEERHQQPAPKRMKSAKTCLRCQIQNKRCSGGFPCERCVNLFKSEGKARHSKTLMWKYCFDSNIKQLNFFNEFSALLCLAQEFPSALFWGSPYYCLLKLEPTAEMRGRKAAAELVHIVQSSTMESGISYLLGFQVARFVLAKSPLRISSIPPLLSMRSLLPRKPLRRHKMCSQNQDHDSSAAWLFAVAILQPDFLAELAGFSKQEIRNFTFAMCYRVYDVTARLLAKARSERMGSVNEDRAILIQNLEIFYHMISNHHVQDRLTDQFERAVFESIDAIRLENDAKDLPDFPTIARLLHAVCSVFLKSIKGEGWGHLQAFTRHWLRKLGGCKRYSEVILRYLPLDTLCRINHKDEIEDEGQLPDFSEKFDRTIIAEAYAMFHLFHHPINPAHPLSPVFEYLRQQGDKGCHDHLSIFIGMSSLFKSRECPSPVSLLCHHQESIFSVGAVATMLDALETSITDMDARKGLNRPQDYKMIPPDDIPDLTLDPTHSGRNPVMANLENLERILFRSVM